MFRFIKKKENPVIVLGSPIKGKVVDLKEVSDPTFGEGLLGKGVAIIPAEGKVYSPADGEIGLIFDTLHAISLISGEGAEILIHVGLDTVQMKGEAFEAHVQAGNRVKKGDLLLTVDLEKIKAAGYDTITPIIVCNTDDYEEVQAITAEAAEAGADVLKLLLKK